MTLKSTLEILDSYEDLTVSQREYVLSKVDPKNLSYTNFDILYTKIARLIENIQTPYIERYMPSLDEKLSSNSDSDSYTLSQFLGTEDLIEFERDEIYRQNNLTKTLSKNITKKLPQTQYLFLEQVVHSSKISNSQLESLISNLSKEGLTKLIDNLNQFQNRIYSAGEDYLTNGLIQVKSFSPLQIKGSSKRNFKENPLEYYKENYALYKGLSKKELSIFDSGLYQSLNKYKQLNLAIPTNKSTNNQIIDSYFEFEGDLKFTSKQIGQKPYLIKRAWENNRRLIISRLKNNNGTRRYFGKNPINYFNDNKLVYSKITRAELADLDESLYRALIKHEQLDLAIPEIKVSGKFTQTQVTEMIDLFKIHNSAKKVSELTGFSPITVSKYLKLNGIETNPKKLTSNKIEQIMESFKINSGDAKLTSKQLNVAESTVRLYWKEENLY